MSEPEGVCQRKKDMHNKRVWQHGETQGAAERENMAKLYINEKNKKGHINPELYGNF